MRVIGRFMRLLCVFLCVYAGKIIKFTAIQENAATFIDRGVFKAYYAVYGFGVAEGAGVAAGHLSLNCTVTSAFTVSCPA